MVFGLFKSKEQKQKEKEENINKSVEIFKNEGWMCAVELPEYETTSRSGTTKAVATLAGGLVGFALASGSKQKKKKIVSLVRIPEKGIVIENATSEGTDLRLSWDSILKIELDKQLLLIKLVDGMEIELGIGFDGVKNAPKLDIEGYHEFCRRVYEYIKDKPTGVVEEGW